MPLVLAFLAPFLISFFLIFLLRHSPPREAFQPRPHPTSKVPLSVLLDRVSHWVAGLGLELELAQVAKTGLIEVIARYDAPILGGRYLIFADFLSEAPLPSMKVQSLEEAVRGEKMLKGIFIASAGFTPAAERFAEQKSIELLDGEKLPQIFQDFEQLFTTPPAT